MLILGAILTEQSLKEMFLLNFISEGFYIGGWVLFWELFSTLFFKSREYSEEAYVLNRLMKSKIKYEIRN